MNSTRMAGASIVVIVAGALLATAAAGTSSARPEPPPEPIPVTVQYGQCALMRVDTQFTRCDNLTGAGVAAPAWVSEQH
jgi:hypothetical protein